MQQTHPKPPTDHAVLKACGYDYRKTLWQIRNNILHPTGLTPEQAHAFQRGEAGDLLMAILFLYDCAVARHEITQFEVALVEALRNGHSQERSLAMHTICSLWVHRRRRVRVAKDQLVTLFRRQVQTRRVEDIFRTSELVRCLGIVRAREVVPDLHVLARKPDPLRYTVWVTLVQLSPETLLPCHLPAIRQEWERTLRRPDSFGCTPYGLTPYASTFSWLCHLIARELPTQYLIRVAQGCKSRAHVKNHHLYFCLAQIVETTCVRRLSKRARARLLTRLRTVLSIRGRSRFCGKGRQAPCDAVGEWRSCYHLGRYLKLLRATLQKHPKSPTEENT